jgi:hypothetical protein
MTMTIWASKVDKLHRRKGAMKRGRVGTKAHKPPARRAILRQGCTSRGKIGEVGSSCPQVYFSFSDEPRQNMAKHAAMSLANWTI